MQTVQNISETVVDVKCKYNASIGISSYMILPLDPPKSRWKIPQKIVKNNKAEILWNFSIQTDELLPISEPDIVKEEPEISTGILNIATANERKR